MISRICLLFMVVIIGACGGGGGSAPTQVSSVQKLSPEGLELGGWTIPMPAAFDTSTYGLTDVEQPGSRLFYISRTGHDPSGVESPTGQIYFWDGTQIVDASGSATGDGDVAYGTDPMNPTGPIKPYQRWVYVAPRRTGWGINNAKVGAAWDGTSYKAPGGGAFRHGFPDWWLFKRGDSFDLQAEYLSFAQETTPSLTETTGSNLAIPGGRSETQPQVMGAYGDLTQPRPRFTNPTSGLFLRAGVEPSPKHTAYLSLHFDGRGTNDKTAAGFSFLGQTVEAENILFEDVWLEALSGSSIQSAAQITLRRVLITDGFNKIDEGSHVQGLYTSGTRDSRIRIEQSILMRNGFKHGDPELSWPPTGAQKWNIYDRNMYLSGECDNDVCGVFDTVSLIGASGDQFRPGMRVERNFFYQGYVQMGAHGGYPDSDGPTGIMVDNILQRFKGTGTDDNRGHPGWGFGLTSGAYRVEVARNIVTGAQHPATSYGLYIDNLGWYCYSHIFEFATRENNIHGNIFDTGTARAAIRVVDGSGNEMDDVADRCGPPANMPGTTGNQVVNNILINATNTESEYITKTNSEDILNDTFFSGNEMYVDRTEAANDLGWVDPERTLKSYLESLGGTVTSDDGFIEYFYEAKKQRRGYWREEYTARPLVNYMREGFGMVPL
jgi:hypothetical protein